MKFANPVIILAGQVYYDAEKNEYLVVRKKSGEEVYYVGRGFCGMLEDCVFINKFQPVDPQDLTKQEADYLVGFCDSGTILKVGFINV
ncbi:MAG: hypothetical protein DDT31_00308 [Syntrophomonadaceae bacterium]|nr:hypothetical protein [Bacillota bacterium]